MPNGRAQPTRLPLECEPWQGMGMTLPTLLALDVLGDASPVTIGFAIGLAGMGVLWGETRVHVTGLREWKREAQAELSSLKATVTALSGRADLQDERMNHILSLLQELRADVKSLLGRKDAD